MIARRLAVAALVGGSLAVSLTGCGPQHATVADCVAWMTKALHEHGTDTKGMEAELVQRCERNKATMSPEEFDQLRG